MKDKILLTRREIINEIDSRDSERKFKSKMDKQFLDAERMKEIVIKIRDDRSTHKCNRILKYIEGDAK